MGVINPEVWWQLELLRQGVEAAIAESRALCDEHEAGVSP